MQQAGTAGVAANKELFEDPQLAHLGYFHRVNHPEIGQCYQQAPPIRPSISPLNIRPAPFRRA
jgi:crotonobetainyl-CoA:carnitine CoA-transferase CaiB-like acyl-CoA transferase